MKSLFLYSSREGQTKKILRYIDKKLIDLECETLNIHNTKKIDLLEYEKVLIGASVHYGHLRKELYRFINMNIEQLQESKGAFFCVNLTARKEKKRKDTPENNTYIKTFLKKSPWKPKLIGVFAGSLDYQKYGFFDRLMIIFIMMITDGKIYVNQKKEYTNWKKVSLFSEAFRKL
ncbi:protoporphyrinogen IX dehydrogenase [Candidatus Photodesmus blepharus]|uniref:Protoporphyrinogen IX dehydrogenase [quinone] n=1 Tax=Candidatus Photodesmus blepharonis TaxID=1179155 RepID=A0A084CNN1_9GAMM|nr:menaquinone-dependent protoporphyrinogen IX dehydrogenase [Candidatus Photodesmus blepharus]KEY91410.1 protoporphyrinogen IX dehydrogenase [Candidatus Photodesmus blepharus]